MRKVPLITKQHYHIYNRGVNKERIFFDEKDMDRFLQCMREFNTRDPIGSIFQNTFRKKYPLSTPTTKEPLVRIVCYCLNHNHYHIILEQLIEGGISKFMQRLAGGYTRFINEKYERSGVLFQSKFKSVHIEDNAQLLHLSAYINLNFRVHKLSSRSTKSSWVEYSTGAKGLCSKEIVQGQFSNPEEYKRFAEETLESIVKRRYENKEYQKDVFLE